MLEEMPFDHKKNRLSQKGEVGGNQMLIYFKKIILYSQIRKEQRQT